MCMNKNDNFVFDTLPTVFLAIMIACASTLTVAGTIWVLMHLFP
jgi:hypothetical protein